MTLNYVTLTVDLGAGQGFYLTSGVASFVPTAVLTDAADHLMVSQVPLSVEFGDSGAPKIKLLATDNVNLSPSGWAWTVTPPAGSGISPFSFFLPFAGGAAQYLSALAPVSSVVTMQAYMPLPSGTAQAGQAPLATGSGSASAWGNVAANPMTTSGDTVYGGASGAITRLPGDTSNTRKFLREQSSAGVAQPPAWDTIAAGDVPTLNQNTTGTAANVTGTVAIGNGGTGQATQQAAIDALAGSQGSGQYLRGTGTHVQMSAIQAGDVPTLNQSTTGTAANVTGVVALANGGTGTNAGSANAAFGALSPMTTLGDITYENSTPAAARLAGNTSATKNFLTQTGTGSVSAAPAWGTIAAGDVPTLNQNTTGTAANITGTLDQVPAPAANVSLNSKKITSLANGTASTDAAAFGQLPVLAAADTSVVVAGTSTAPTVRTGTLDVVAAQHPAAADWSNNSHKITSLANGSAASDAAAFGQIPVADSTAANILPDGVQAAGANGKWADSGHVHQNNADLSLFLAPSGATAETFPRRLALNVSSALTSGTLCVSAIPMAKGIAVNNLTMFTNTTAKTGGSHGWYVLLDSGLVVRAVTADQTDAATIWGTASTKYTLATTATYTTTAAGLYYIGVMVVATGMPTFTIGSTLATGINATTPLLAATSSTAQTTPPSTGTTMTALSGGGGFQFYGYTS